MKSTFSVRSIIYPLLLVAALAVALWLADSFEKRVAQVPRQGAGGRPTFAPPGGVYDDSFLLDIRPSDPRAQVIFATGGPAPMLTVGTLYERPLLFDAGVPGVTVVRAREVAGGTAGPVVSASYVVGMGVEGEGEALPILSIIADPFDLWDAERGLLTNTWRRGSEWERPVHVTFFGGRDLQFEIPAGLRVHGSERFDVPKQSFRLYFRDAYGAARLQAPLFSDHVQSYNCLLLQAGDRSGRWTLLEEQLVAEIASEITDGIGGRVTQGRFVLLFVNGQSWGVYRLSERIDRFFLRDNFGLGNVDLMRHGTIEEGDGAHWDALMDWLAAHDLRDADDWAYIETQLDIESFTDYAILQIYFGFPADRFSAVRPRVSGARWSWLYGDWRQGWTLKPSADAGLTLLTAPDDADKNNLAFLLHKLLENPSYRARFVGRAADLLNTALSPSAVEARVDGLSALLRPGIAYERAIWPAPTDWEQNVAALQNILQQRPRALRRRMVRELGLRGAVDLTFGVSPDGGGIIFVNGTPAATNPWSGTYFIDSEVQAIALPASGYTFAGWAQDNFQFPISNEQFPKDVSAPLPLITPLPLMTATVNETRTFTARFVPVAERDLVLRSPNANDVIINEYWINDNGTRYATIGDRPIEGDWLELLVARPGLVDLRGWRVTDNDTKTGEREGSLILPQLEALSAVPHGTVILIVATASNSNAAYFGSDDLDAGDGRMVFYVGNGNLDVATDPGFGIGPNDDNLALLAPGPTSAFADDVGIDFVAEGETVTPYSFGILADGVVFGPPFRGLGNDDGLFFSGDTDNDAGDVGWTVDPPADQSGDGTRLDGVNVLTPGASNHRPSGLAIHPAISTRWLALVGLIAAASAVYVRVRRAQSEARKTRGK